MTNSKNMISIIIPVYNVERYLRQCLNSVVHQTEKNVEIICIDDNSSDNSYAILQEFALTDPRFILMRNPRNLGAARTRNIGLQIANGKYVAILDSDDYYELNFLEKMYLSIEKNNADMCVCRYSRISSLTDEVVSPDISEKQKKEIQDGFSIYRNPNLIFTIGNIGPTTKLYRREFLIDEQILFQDLRNSNDIFFGVMVRALAKKIMYIPEVLVHYRVDESADSTSMTRRMHPYCGYEAWFKCYKCLQRLNLLDICKKSFHERAFRTVEFTLKFTKGEKKQELINFWIKTGFPNIGMDNRQENDFLTQECFHSYEQIASDKTNDLKFDTDVNKYSRNENNMLTISENEEKLSSKYLFPYHLFQRNNSVLLYGDNVASKQFYKQASTYVYVNIVGTISEEITDKKILKSYISKHVFDYILITEPNRNIAENQKKILMDAGLDDTCIKWDGDIYLEKDFYNKVLFNFLDVMRGMYPDDRLSKETRGVMTDKMYKGVGNVADDISTIRKEIELLSKESKKYYELFNRYVVNNALGMTSRTNCSVDELLKLSKHVVIDQDVEAPHFKELFKIMFGDHVTEITCNTGKFDLGCCRNIKIDYEKKLGRNKAKLFINAMENGSPVVFLEDGFIESIVPWNRREEKEKYRQNHSLIIDRTGVYFDARHPSDLERILNSDVDFTFEEIQRSKRLISKILENKISKYNYQPIKECNIGSRKEKVLIIDQVASDASIIYGGGYDDIFDEILSVAMRENPNSDIIIKKHPVTIKSTKQGVYQKNDDERIYFIDYEINPICLLQYVNKVYVCSSQMGFEALMCGKEVHVFGMPFYAGWGLTIDYRKCERRNKKRSLEEVFYAAYILYTKYVSIKHRKRCELEDLLDEILELREDYWRESGEIND